MKLLTTGNPKTAKGEKAGYLTAILHLAPANLSGIEVCQFRTKGCTAACLNTAGRGGIVKKGESSNNIQRCRIARTQLMARDFPGFKSQLIDEIAAHIRLAGRHELKPAIRLNGTSDLPVETWGVMELFPTVQFYDYTKSAARMLSFATDRMPRNYHLTFSLAETTANKVASFTVLENGANVAAVFAVKPSQELPLFWRGFPVIDGDKSDLRFLDFKALPGDSGHIVGLRAKGKGRKDTSGFVITAF